MECPYSQQAKHKKPTRIFLEVATKRIIGLRVLDDEVLMFLFKWCPCLRFRTKVCFVEEPWTVSFIRPLLVKVEQICGSNVKVNSTKGTVDSSLDVDNVALGMVALEASEHLHEKNHLAVPLVKFLTLTLAASCFCYDLAQERYRGITVVALQ